MKSIKIIDVKESIFSENNKEAQALREELASKGTFLLNLMSSPGSGKTTTLTRLINELKDEFTIAVMEADIDSCVDAESISENTGVKAIQLHTGGMCHLDASMVKQGIDGLEGFKADLIVIENVGNLVCPAEFDTGAMKNMMILSVPEGHDKPLKYPLMFTVSDIAVINKIDVAPYFDFDFDECRKNILMRNPAAVIVPVSAKTGEGIDTLAGILRSEIKALKGGNAQ